MPTGWLHLPAEFSMVYKLLVMFHLLGAAVWIGGHIVLVRVVLPAALRDQEPRRIVEFERGFGRVGLIALALQLITGLWLAGIWLGGWRNVLNFSVPSAPLVLTKLALVATTLFLAGRAYHTVLPRLQDGGMKAFVVHARVVTVLSVLLLIVGASIRLGGLW